MILCNNQYCFREIHSTLNALVSFIYTVASAIDDKKFFASVFLDLSKAFDTIDHSILLRKFELYGLSGTVLNRVKCYLSNRTQVIQINWITSCEREIVESPRDPFQVHCSSALMIFPKAQEMLNVYSLLMILVFLSTLQP